MPKCDICETVHQPHQAHVFAPRVLARTGVTNVTTPCNHCVTKDAEIERLRNQLDALVTKDVTTGARDRAEYMRQYRKRAQA